MLVGWIAQRIEVVACPCQSCKCNCVPAQIEVSPSAVAFITQVPFVIALLGITYSIMSTSWDPDVSSSISSSLFCH